jgi:hypothetical protein
VDWGLQNQLKSEGIGLLLPDVQQLRELAAVLKVRLRGEIARGEFDNAVRSARTLLALSHTFDSHPTLIGQLVGIAIASLTLDALEEFVQQPGAPNLFWALTDLPDPFIELRKGLQGERVWVGKEFDALGRTAPLADAELAKLTEVLDAILHNPDEKKKRLVPSQWYREQAAAAASLTAARERLAGGGFNAAELGRLSPLQVVMMDDFARFNEFKDEMMKWANLPYWRLPPGWEGPKIPNGAFAELAPALLRVKQAQARLQQRFALLAIVEAVRLHAAGNGGQVPSALDVVKLPLPVDPFTGRSFGYEVAGGKAVVRATPPADRVKDPTYNRVYEITIRK